VEDYVRCVVIDSTGSIEHVPPLGFHPTQFTSGGGLLLGHRHEDDGHNQTAGEIGILDLVTGEYADITHTGDHIEWRPHLCEANDRIVFEEDEQVVVGRLERIPD
jgi:hypothetical protein